MPHLAQDGSPVPWSDGQEDASGFQVTVSRQLPRLPSIRLWQEEAASTHSSLLSLVSMLLRFSSFAHGERQVCHSTTKQTVPLKSGQLISKNERVPKWRNSPSPTGGDYYLSTVRRTKTLPWLPIPYG